MCLVTETSRTVVERARSGWVAEICPLTVLGLLLSTDVASTAFDLVLRIQASRWLIISDVWFVLLQLKQSVRKIEKLVVKICLSPRRRIPASWPEVGCLPMVCLAGCFSSDPGSAQPWETSVEVVPVIFTFLYVSWERAGYEACYPGPWESAVHPEARPARCRSPGSVLTERTQGSQPFGGLTSSGGFSVKFEMWRAIYILSLVVEGCSFFICDLLITECLASWNQRLL